MRAGPEVVDHAGQARGEDVHAVHEPQRAPAHLQALLARLAEDSEFGAALALGFGAALGMALSGSLPSLALAALVVTVLAELFSRRPADRRAHRGDVAQQEVEIVPSPL